jgi:hypothetical protein
MLAISDVREQPSPLGCLCSAVSSTASEAIAWNIFEETLLSGNALSEWPARHVMLFQQLYFVQCLEVIANEMMGCVGKWPSRASFWPQSSQFLSDLSASEMTFRRRLCMASIDAPSDSCVSSMYLRRRGPHPRRWTKPRRQHRSDRGRACIDFFSGKIRCHQSRIQLTKSVGIGAHYDKSM